MRKCKTMMYQYKVIQLTNHSKELEEALNKFARKGYRLANFFEVDGHLQLIFEMELVE